MTSGTAPFISCLKGGRQQEARGRRETPVWRPSLLLWASLLFCLTLWIPRGILETKETTIVSCNHTGPFFAMKETQDTRPVSSDHLSPRDLAQKQHILDAVRERMLAEGFTRLSVEEIAGMFGMSKKTFYKFFPTKEELINQVADRIMAEGRVSLARIVGSDKDFLSKLHELMSFVMLQSTRISKALQTDVQRYAPDLWKRIEEFRTYRISDVFSHLVEQGIKEGYVRADVNKRIFLLVVLGSIRSVINPTVLAHESFSAREAVDNVLSLFFTGILTDQGRAGLEHLRKNQLSSPQSEGAQ